jgi:hypothetical protein
MSETKTDRQTDNTLTIKGTVAATFTLDMFEIMLKMILNKHQSVLPVYKHLVESTFLTYFYSL